jgi:DNA topoisomerase VI subunit B
MAIAAKTKGKGDTFERKTFSVSRLAEFATLDELTKQTGQPPENWVLVVIKELVDNALDEAEKAGIAPNVEVVVSDNSITVADLGRGVPHALIKALTDYSIKTSSNAAYVSPTRGQQGNALQSILPMGFVLDGKQGEILIESQGRAHAIRFTVDPVRKTPVVSCDIAQSAVKIGTRITVRWPDSPRSPIAAAKRGILSLLAIYTWVNPHLSFGMKWLSEPYLGEATNPGWSKWTPNQPTSPHWYDEERLSRLIAAEIAFAEDRRKTCPSVREFIGQLRGLKGTAKQNAICKKIGVAERETLAEFYQRPVAVRRLLATMQAQARPVKPRDLGVIGEDHLMADLIGDGCDEDSIVYRKTEFEHDGLPYVIEVAFGYRGEEDENPRRVAEGFNFAPAIGGSPFRLAGVWRTSMSTPTTR